MLAYKSKVSEGVVYEVESEGKTFIVAYSNKEYIEITESESQFTFEEFEFILNCAKAFKHDRFPVEGMVM